MSGRRSLDGERGRRSQNGGYEYEGLSLGGERPREYSGLRIGRRGPRGEGGRQVLDGGWGCLSPRGEKGRPSRDGE